MNKFLPRTSNNTKGFTLVELLVVISIIAFLSVIGVTAFSNAQKTARDGRRRADVDAISKAYESGYDAVAGTYTAIDGTKFTTNQLPQDPINSGSNVYTHAMINSNKGFYACADLEVDNGNATGPTAGGYGTTTLGSYYCKKGQLSQ